MQIESLSFGENPAQIVQDKFDCIWVALDPRKEPSAIASAVIQWLDWKLQGQISRFILDERTVTTVIPTMGRIPSPYLVVDNHKSADWTTFGRNCEGMKFSRVLYVCEDSALLPRREAEMRKSSFPQFPECVVLGSDS